MSCNAASWAGYCSVGGYTLPIKSGSCNVISEFSNSKSIAAPTSAYARSIKTYTKGRQHTEANLSFDMFASGQYGLACKSLLTDFLSRCGTLSASGGGGSSIVLSPAGGSNFTVPGSGGKGVVNSISLKGNNGGLVQASVNILSTSVDYGSGGSATQQFESVGTTEDYSPLAWYSSSFIVTGAGDATLMANYITDWNLTIHNNAELVYGLCNTTTESDGITVARDIRLGQLDVTGSFSYWSPTGTFSPNLKSGASIIINLQNFTLTLPHVVFPGDDLPTDASKAEVTRTVNYRGYGDSGKAAIY